MLDENTYVVSNIEGDAIVIDPGGEFERLNEHVTARDLRVHAIFATHGHPDHLGAAARVRDSYRAPFHLHPADEAFLPRTNFYRAVLYGEGPVSVPDVDVRLEHESELHFGSIHVQVLHTPGHTPGSVCFEMGGEVFTGDTLTAHHLGRTDLPGGDRKALDASIATLVDRFPGQATLRPGHGEPARFEEVVSRLVEMAEVRE